MWQTIYAWPWATIWSAVSAIFTAAAVGVAGWAMLRWRKQDELKVKQDFRNAIHKLCDAMAQMPHSFENQKLIVEYSDKLDEITTLYIACSHAWLGTEGLLEKNKVVAENWKKIGPGYTAYMQGEEPADIVLGLCRKIMGAKFIFN